MSQILMNVPEPGQLVDVRQRRYVVVDITQGTLPPDLLKAGSLGQSYHNHRGQHLVSLASVEDDDLGEELQVIWEIEPGVKVSERHALPVPVGFDAPRQPSRSKPFRGCLPDRERDERSAVILWYMPT